MHVLCVCVCVCDGVMILSCLRFAIENMRMLERMRRQTWSTRTLTALPTHTLHWSFLTNRIKNGENWGWMVEHYHNTIMIITLVQLLQHTHTHSIREHQQYIATEGEREREREREREDTVQQEECQKGCSVSQDRNSSYVSCLMGKLTGKYLRHCNITTEMTFSSSTH